jgi:archaellum biogenesis ATPase FlaH
MAEELHAQVAAKLEEIGPSVAVALELKVDNYFDVIRGLVDDFSARKGLCCFYITASVPSSTLSNALVALEVDTKDVRFVDCISHTLMGKIEPGERVAHVESPSMLEYVVLKVEYFARQNEGKKALVIIDSANSFAIHNDIKMLSEFFTVLLNSLKVREAYPVVLSLPDSLKPEVKEMLALVCDYTLTI